MTTEAVFTKRVARSGSGRLVWIPKDIATLLGLEDADIVEIRMKRLPRGERGS